MKRFRCEVTATSVYEIEIDDHELGHVFLDEFRNHFYDFDSWEEHAEFIAARKALGDVFIEGYGVPLENGGNPEPWSRKDSELEKAINIVVKYENEIDVDCVEVK